MNLVINLYVLVIGVLHCQVTVQDKFETCTFDVCMNKASWRGDASWIKERVYTRLYEKYHGSKESWTRMMHIKEMKFSKEF